MKHQALFSSKDKSKKLKCCLLQFLFGALGVNFRMIPHIFDSYILYVTLGCFTCFHLIGIEGYSGVNYIKFQ